MLLLALMVYLIGYFLAFGLAKYTAIVEHREKGVKWTSGHTARLVQLSLFSWLIVLIGLFDKNTRLGLCYITPEDSL